MRISRVESNDIESIIDLENRVFNHTLGKDIIEGDISRLNALYLKISESEKMIGYISIRINIDKAEMLNFVIEPKYQHQGYGNKLLKHVFQELTKIGVNSIILEVREYNDNAIKFYEKNGFKKILIRKNYYGDCDAIVYIKENL